MKSVNPGKGGWSILVAFHMEQRRRGADFRGPLFKREIISLAQVRDMCAVCAATPYTPQQFYETLNPKYETLNPKPHKAFTRKHFYET